MSLYAALETILVSEGPLENLFSYRLPPEQTGVVDVAFIPQGGGNPERYFGSEPVVNGPPGVTHDGGVLWHETAVQFQARSESPEAVVGVADWIRDLLVQFAGDPIVRGDEEIIRIDITTSPHYFGQDEQERPIAALTVEVWHRPA